MILIAHRGNIQCPNPIKENHPDYILEAVNKGYDAEVDVWKIDNKFILGHDGPQYEVDINFLFNDHFWLHAKNMEAIVALNKHPKNYLLNFFFHDTDACTLTSQGWIWVYPGKSILSNSSIAVMPERIRDQYDISKGGGICSDYVQFYKNDLNFKL